MRTLNGALAAAGGDGIPMLLLLGPIDVNGEAIGVLGQCLERDPMRLCHASDCGPVLFLPRLATPYWARRNGARESSPICQTSNSSLKSLPPVLIGPQILVISARWIGLLRRSRGDPHVPCPSVRFRTVLSNRAGGH
jgi:hypothetical protein